MKAAVFHGAGKPLAIENIPDPKPRPTDVIIKVHRCGLCGTDLSLTSGGPFDFPVGSVLGHEYVGEVVEVGSEVEKFRKGDIVTSVPTLGCGHCNACFHGAWTLCDQMQPTMGGFAEYMFLPSGATIKLPSIYTAADGALVEPFAIGLFGVRTAQIEPHDRILVLGGGSVALSVTFWAKRLGGGKVVVASRSERRAKHALAMGADAFVQTGEGEVQRVIEALGGPPQIVFECIGATGTLGQSLNHVGKFGKIVSMGFCTSPDPIIPAIAAFKAPKISFPVGYSLRDYEYVADNMLSGKIDPKSIVTSVVSLDEFPAVFDALRGPNHETKVHLQF